MCCYVLAKIKENISQRWFGALYLCPGSWEGGRELEERMLFSARSSHVAKEIKGTILHLEFIKPKKKVEAN